MRAILGTLLLVASTCVAAVEMMDRVEQELPPSAAEALIIFVYPADNAEYVRMSIADVTEPAPRLVGIIEPGSKVLHRVKPGQYLFMLNYTYASFLQADVAAGKTYYAVVNKDVPQGRFSVINRYTLNAVQDLTELLFVRAERNASAWIKSPKADVWFSPREKAFTTKKNKFLPAWEQMTAAEKAAYTLQQANGR